MGVVIGIVALNSLHFPHLEAFTIMIDPRVQDAIYAEGSYIFLHSYQNLLNVLQLSYILPTSSPTKLEKLSFKILQYPTISFSKSSRHPEETFSIQLLFNTKLL